ncbi:MAG: DMT family transporter [Actinomycetota bacterium]|nr:DMT family transporter [Actinomycetota bacterium]
MTARQAGLLGTLAALWGASYLLIKYALEDFSPGAVVFARTLLGAAVLYAVIRAQGGEYVARLDELRRRPGTAVVLGTVAIAAPFLLISFGELEVPSGLTGVLIASAPLWVATFAPLIDPSEKVARRQATGLLVGIAGVALLVGVESIGSAAEFLGALGIVGAAASYALASFMVKGAYRDVPALTTSFISVGAGCLLTLPLAAATPPTELPGVRSMAALAALGVLGTAAAFVIFYRLIAELGAGRAALVSYLVPPISLAYGALLLDEAITPAALAGLLLILGGVALASRPPQAAPEGAEAIPEPERA